MRRIYITYPEWKTKAFTTSYDDGTVHDYRLVTLFNKYNIKGTFNLNGGLIREDRIPFKEYPEVYKNHEVACHTLTHPTISREPIALVAQEVIEDRKALEDLMGYPIRGMAYPNGSTSKEIEALLPTLGIVYARTVESTNSFELPENWIHLNPTCHHRENILDKADEFIAFSKKQYLKLFYLWGHSFEFNTDDNWDLIEKFVAKIARRDDIWYATNIEIYDYLKAAKELITSAKGNILINPTAKDIYLEIDGVNTLLKAGQRIDL